MSKELESANIRMWRESLDTSISSFLGVLSDVIHVFILVRFLTQEEVGLFFICYAFLYLFSQISRGFGIAIRKRSSEVNNERSVYLWCGLGLILPSLFFVYFLFWLSQPILAQYASIVIPYPVLVSLYLATTGFSVLEFSRYYVAGCGKPALAEKLRTSIAKTSMPVLTVIALSFQSDVSFALYAVFISYMATSIIIFAYADYRFILPDKDTIYGVLRFSKWSILTSILNDFYRRFDTIMLGALVGSTAVSFYDSSLRVAFLSTTFAVGISKTSNVKMSGMIESGRNIKNIASKSIIMSPVLSLPLLIICAFSSEYLLGVLFGGQYTSAKWYLILLVVVEIFQGYRLQFESIFNSYDKPLYTTRTSLLSVIVNVISAPFLVIQFGGLGVVYSTIISEIFRLIMYEIQLNSVMGEYILPRSTVKQYIVGGMIYVVLFIIHSLLSLSGVASLALTFMFSTVGLYSIVYLISEPLKDIVKDYRKTN